MLCIHALIISAGKAYHEQHSVVEIAISICELDSPIVKCAPRRGKCVACCPEYRNDAFSKDVSAVSGGDHDDALR